MGGRSGGKSEGRGTITVRARPGWTGRVWTVFMLALAAAFLSPGGWLAAQEGQSRPDALVSARSHAKKAPEPSAPPALLLTRATAPVEIDGRLTETAWDDAPLATDFVQQTPDEGEPATFDTEVRVLHDADALYVGVRLSDPHPDSVVARLARRDEDVHADWFYVYLDSYHDRRSAFGFGVSAAGLQRDLRFSEDTHRDTSWDAVWESAVEVDAGGWTAELRIPFSQLRFSEGDTSARWGIEFGRLLARRNERSHWAPVPQGANRFVSLFGTLEGVDALEPETGLELIPYTVARIDRAPGDPDDPFHSSTEPFGSVGADLRMGLGSGFTLSATLNPDFGQVEADPEVVNLTAFQTFNRERRPFFVEGAELFRPIYPMFPPVFHSRRIGRRPQGSVPGEARYADVPDATTILGAAKLSGKTEDGWSVGLLEAVTATERAPFVTADGTRGEAVVEPRTSYAVGRVAREFHEGRSVVGVLATATNRFLGEVDDAPGRGLETLHSSAYAAGVDGFHRFGGDAYEARFGLLATHVRGSEEALLRTQRAPGRYFQRPDAGHLELNPERTSLTGYRAGLQLGKTAGNWRWGLNSLATSPGFEVNDLGFNTDVDRLWLNTHLAYHDFTPGSFLRNWRLGLYQGHGETFGGERRTRFVSLSGGFTTLDFWDGGFWVERQLATLDPTALRGGPALHAPPSWGAGGSLTSDRRKVVSGRVFGFWRREDGRGGRELRTDATVTLRPSDRWSVELGPEVFRRTSPWQYVTRASPEDGVEPAYVVGRLEQRTLALSTRLDYTFSPDLTLQLYARPFLGSGAYTDFREVADPRAGAFDERFRTYAEGAVERANVEGEGPRVRVDRDGDGTADLTFAEPDFNTASLQVNAVLRWEYRPGSTLFAVWSHDRSASGRQHFDLGRDLDRLRRAQGRDVFTVKVSYWLGL